MLKVNVLRGLMSGHRTYDYVMVSGSPDEIAELIESLSRQLAEHLRTGRDGGRAEPRFEGSVFVGNEEKERLGGHFSISIAPEMRCAHPGCREEFDALNSSPAAAFRKSGLVCEKHESEARWTPTKNATSDDGGR